MTPPAATGPLIDGFGRVHTDLRISITDRCNFRCTYCMPTEGMQWLPRPELLTYEEIERIARVAVTELGITSIRITGGEPTVRSHLPVLVAKLARLGVDVALTTNGATLASQAADLAAAGLHRVNISLDTLQPDRFAAITRRDDLERVLAGVEAAVAAGLQPVKLNAVIVRGVNDDEIEALAAYGREVGAEVRFIEFMPLDGDGTWDVEAVVPAAEIVARLDAAFGLAPAEARGHEPAARRRYADGRGAVGVIASVTDAFCDRCDRIRLTAEGRLRSCLFALDEVDLRRVVRDDAADAASTDAAIAAAIRGAVADKWAGHHIAQPVFVRPSRSMSQIGG